MIGSGPAGQRGALQAAKLGRSVLVIERSPFVGGACVEWGTLPSKSFRESVYRYSLGSGGVLGREQVDDSKNQKPLQIPEMSRLLKRKQRVIKAEIEVVGHQMERNKIECVHGNAVFVDPHHVEVGGEIFEGKYILIAVGARPVGPKHITVDHQKVVDSDSILNMPSVPKTMVVLGAGIIGCEYASMFSMAGTEVILVDRRPQILANVDREIASGLLQRFEYQGMKTILSAEATAVHDLGSDGLKVDLSNGQSIKTDVVCVALGRKGNTELLALEKLGVEPDDRGLLKVNTYFQTKVPHVYAAGDVIGAPALASTSMEQGRLSAAHMFSKDHFHPMPTVFPFGIYSIPEIAMLGQTEEELIAGKIDYVAGKARYKEIARGQIVGDRFGLLKLLIHRESLKILGVHIVGDNAAELIHIGQAVMTLGGDVRYFISSVFNYPTLAEAYKNAAFHAVNQITGVTKTL